VKEKQKETNNSLASSQEWTSIYASIVDSQCLDAFLIAVGTLLITLVDIPQMNTCIAPDFNRKLGHIN
jgi:hypothetical protein